MQLWNMKTSRYIYNLLFEGNQNSDMAQEEIEFDTPVLQCWKADWFYESAYFHLVYLFCRHTWDVLILRYHLYTPGTSSATT